MLEDLKYNWKWTADPEYPREEVAKPSGSASPRNISQHMIHCLFLL